MSTSAISIQNISKEYLIQKGKNKEVFKALENINLEIEEGKVTGLIGANGAGKSTLLKILSRITQPSSGHAHINGRLASLLEVGTGFHPELSGRENIFLNGALLGMKKPEIKAQFDEIVDFSGVEAFLDTPVKHYSSGMYVRLAFSVAAHLQSEILLIDEVLAVGDAEFQRKCIAKMDEATHQQNRTVLFVSHNMSVARSLCEQIIFLEKGKVKTIGDAKSVTDQYMREMTETANALPIGQRKDRKGSGELKFSQLEISHPNSKNGSLLISGEPAVINFSIKSLKPSATHDLDLELNIFNASGNFLSSLSNKFVGTSLKLEGEEQSFECTINKLPLMAGSYYLRAKLMINGFPVDLIDRALNFEVLLGDYYGSGNFKQKATPGIYIDQNWKSKP